MDVEDESEDYSHDEEKEVLKSRAAVTLSKVRMVNPLPFPSLLNHAQLQSSQAKKGPTMQRLGKQRPPSDNEEDDSGDDDKAEEITSGQQDCFLGSWGFAGM